MKSESIWQLNNYPDYNIVNTIRLGGWMEYLKMEAKKVREYFKTFIHLYSFCYPKWFPFHIMRIIFARFRRLAEFVFSIQYFLQQFTLALRSFFYQCTFYLFFPIFFKIKLCCLKKFKNTFVEAKACFLFWIPTLKTMYFDFEKQMTATVRITDLDNHSLVMMVWFDAFR